MSKQKVNTDDALQRLAWKYGVSKREIERCIQFAQAVDYLADRFGRDMRNCLLDHGRRVRLRHGEIVKLAAAASLQPDRFADLGHVIRAGDTQHIRYMLRGD
jgi:hypothetical protein